MVANTFSTFKSLTVHCARCHDHKFDPIPQEDYYRLQAVFAGVDRADRASSNPEAAALAARKLEVEARRKALLKKADAATGPELAPIDAELAALKDRLATLAGASALIVSPTNGYHSAIASRPDVEQWVQVDLGRPVPIDEVRLVPARPTDFADTPGFGFPVRFRVDLADDATFDRPERIADHTDADFANPKDEAVALRAGRRPPASCA